MVVSARPDRGVPRGHGALRIPPASWPFTTENALSAALRREAKAAGAYWFSGDPQPELLREAAIAKRMFQAFREITEDDDAYFYLMAPHCEAKDASAAWVADPALLRPENFAAFEVVLTRLKDFALPPRVNGGNHPSNGACHEQEILALG